MPWPERLGEELIFDTSKSQWLLIMCFKVMNSLNRNVLSHTL